MPVFLENEQHVLIQLESDNDWESLYHICEGYITYRDAVQIKKRFAVNKNKKAWHLKNKILLIIIKK